MFNAAIYFKPAIDNPNVIPIIKTALKLFFEDNDLAIEDRNVRKKIASYYQWPQSKNGEKPEIDIIKKDTDYLLTIICNFEPIRGFFNLNFSDFAFKLYDLLDCSSIILQEIGPLQIDPEKSSITYTTDDSNQTETLHYINRYLYGTDEDLKERPHKLENYGHLYSLKELKKAIENDDISDYDGEGKLLRKENDQWYTCDLNLSVDHPIPAYVFNHFTHFMWYNK